MEIQIWVEKTRKKLTLPLERNLYVGSLLLYMMIWSLEGLGEVGGE